MATLIPHPDSRNDADGLRVEAEVRALADDRLGVEFRVSGDVGRILVPRAAAEAGFESGLWQHTCFELFVARVGDAAYHEFNFAPSGSWALFGFADYRNGSAIEDPRNRPDLAWRTRADGLELDAAISLAALGDGYRRAPLAVAPTAVLEDKAGRHTFWAAAHPAAAPDFHHRDGFVFSVEARRPA